jgi:hypothetical protein
MITGFVFTMMLAIEYINVRTRGWWQAGLRESGWRQHALAVLLGAIPGCLGAFTVVSLYAHGAMSFGALIGTMVATSGDESFVMLAMFPGRTLIFTLGLVGLGWVMAAVVDRFLPALAPALPSDHRLEVHAEDECCCFQPDAILGQLVHLSVRRGALLGFFLLFLLGFLSGRLGPGSWNWIRTTLLGGALFGLFIALTVPDHFLEEHLWAHVVKRHLPKIFAWTFGALFTLSVLQVWFDPGEWIRGNLLAVLLIASLVGLVPESGPHMAFVTLYAEGILPVGILVASSIVQDGHGALPLLAMSRRAFLIMKSLNLVVGLAVGGLLLLLGS